MIEPPSDPANNTSWPESAAKRDLWNCIAPNKRRWRSRNRTYYQSLSTLFAFLVPRGVRVLEIGCATGELLAELKPLYGVGIDLSPEMVKLASEAFAEYKFLEGDAHHLQIEEKFDYVILSDVVGLLDDVQKCFTELQKVSTPRTRVVITHYSKLWSPVIRLAEKCGLKAPSGEVNWLTLDDFENLFRLAGFEVVKSGRRLLLPFYIPLVSWFANRILANLPILNRLCLVTYSVARPIRWGSRTGPYSVSVVIPTLNEVGNLEGAVRRTPCMGSHTELIFVDGRSSDGTVEKIRQLMVEHPARDIQFAFQSGKGKAGAVRTGFSWQKATS